MAVLGVLKPRPTSLYHLRPPFPTLFCLAPAFFFELRKMCGCFWKARSLWTASSVAILTTMRGWLCENWRGGSCAVVTSQQINEVP